MQKSQDLRVLAFLHEGPSGVQGGVHQALHEVREAFLKVRGEFHELEADGHGIVTCGVGNPGLDGLVGQHGVFQHEVVQQGGALQHIHQLQHRLWRLESASSRTQHGDRQSGETVSAEVEPDLDVDPGLCARVLAELLKHPGLLCRSFCPQFEPFATGILLEGVLKFPGRDPQMVLNPPPGVCLNLLSTFVFDTEGLSRATPEALAEVQLRRINELVAYARRHAPFYERRYRGLPEVIRDVRELPPVTKRELMANFDEVVTDPAVREIEVRRHLADVTQVGHPFLGKYMLWRSSGTTGSPCLTLADSHWEAATTALNVVRLAQAWYTPDVVRRMQALGGLRVSIFTDKAHSMGGTQLSRQRRTNPQTARCLRLVPITLPIPEMVETLNELQPASLTGYAAALEILALEQLAGRLCIRPAVVVSTGELLRPQARARMLEAFGIPPRNLYGTTEAGLIGYECALGHLHLNADWTLFEPVSVAHHPSVSGEMSERVLVTNLANRILPVIRCELTDRARILPGRCACGLTLPLLEVSGRADDILLVPGIAGGQVPLLPLALAAALQQTLGIARFQVIQTAPAQLRIRLLHRDPAEADANWAASVRNMRQMLEEHRAAPVDLVRAEEPPECDPVSGKFREAWSVLVR